MEIRLFSRFGMTGNFLANVRNAVFDRRGGIDKQLESCFFLVFEVEILFVVVLFWVLPGVRLVSQYEALFGVR